MIVVALDGPALKVPGDLTTLDSFDGSDVAPFGALAELAPPAKAYVQSLTAPCTDDASPLYDRSRNPLPGCVEAKLDDGDWQVTTDAFEDFDSLGDGNHSFSVRATDDMEIGRAHV